MASLPLRRQLVPVARLRPGKRHAANGANCGGVLLIPPPPAEVFAELRTQKVSDYHGTRSLPADLFDRIAQLCDAYMLEDDAARETIRGQISFEISFLFFLFSHQAAVLAVRESSEKLITQSITALLIENGSFDYRDTIVALSAVYDAASRIGVDSNILFVRMSALGDANMRNQLLSFAEREPEQQDIHKFGFEPGKDEFGNFIYTPLKI
jgi:hypothetical protein